MKEIKLKRIAWTMAFLVFSLLSSARADNDTKSEYQLLFDEHKIHINATVPGDFCYLNPYADMELKLCGYYGGLERDYVGDGRLFLSVVTLRNTAIEKEN